MKSSDVIDPAVLEMPFAVNGDKNNIPAMNTPSTGYASQSLGFPPITEEEPEDGGIPPDRKDFNGLGYITTSHSFYSQTGSLYTFSESVSAAIGGYPAGAKLWYTDAENKVRLLVSLKDDNTDNFITTPSVIGPEGSWNDVIASDEFVAQNYINKNRVNNCLMSVGASVWASLAGNELSLTAEITCAIPDERDSEGVPQSLSVTLPSGTETTLDTSSEGSWFILATDGSLSSLAQENFFNGTYPTPTSGKKYLVFDELKNAFFFSDTGSAYEKISCAIVGEYEVSGSTAADLTLYQPYTLATQTDVARMIKIINNKIQLVSAVPANAESNVLYCIAES